jgi:hypothetical protein
MLTELIVSRGTKIYSVNNFDWTFGFFKTLFNDVGFVAPNEDDYDYKYEGIR